MSTQLFPPDKAWHETSRLDVGKISVYISDSVPVQDAFGRVTPNPHVGHLFNSENTAYFILEKGTCVDARNLPLLARVLLAEGSSKTVEAILEKSLYDIPVSLGCLDQIQHERAI